MRESAAVSWCGCRYCVAEREKADKPRDQEYMTRVQLEAALVEMRRERDHWRDEYKTLEVAAGLLHNECDALRAQVEVGG